MQSGQVEAHAKSQILWSECTASSWYNAAVYKMPTAKIYKKIKPCTLVYSLVFQYVRVLFYITVLLETVTLEK